MTNSKGPLSIRLTESVVFLRGALDPVLSRRQQHVDQQAPPAMLRGLLIMHLTKPTRISSIEIELEGKSVIHVPEGSGSRRIDVSEESVFLSTRIVLYDATTHSSCKRSASLEPSSHYRSDPGHEYVDRDDEANIMTPASSTLPPSFLSAFDHPSPTPPPSRLTPASHQQRRNSAEGYRWQQYSPIEQVTRTLPPDQFATPPVSPPYSPLQSAFELPATSRPETPLGHRGESFHYDSRSLRNDDPGQMLEDFRNALRMEIGGSTRSITSRTSLTSSPVTIEVNGSSLSNPPLGYDRNRSRSASGQSRTLRSASAASPPPSPGVSLPFHDLSLEYGTDTLRGRRSSSRWSLSNMTNMFRDAKDKLRNRSKDTDVQRGRNPEPRPDRQQHVDPVFSEDCNTDPRDHRKTALTKLTSAVGLDETSHIGNWKELRKGTYTYPISFAIPASCPPTIRCDYGAISYRLRGVVHRPGPLTSKLATSREVILVTGPSDDDTEETHAVNVERQWDTQLRYLITLGGRSFVIGSHVPFSLTLMPLEKIKIYRVSIILEEKTEYRINKGTSMREQSIKRFELLSIKHPDKTPTPILPIDPEHGSLLSPYLEVSPTCTADEALASLMGPGPWVLTRDLELPSECGKLHFTYKHKNAAITVNHTLKIIFRAERGDDEAVDPKTGKRRLFDIVVQAPIQILSCHCNPEWTHLPRYSSHDAANDDLSFTRTCGCLTGLAGRPALSRDNSSPAITPSNATTPFNSRPTTAEQNSATPPTLGTFSASELSGFVSNSYHFARLMSGEEGVLGDTPPQYQDLASQSS